MKTTLFLLLCLLYCSIIQAQITVTSSDFPTVGDTLHFKVGNNNAFNSNATDTNYTWDFSQVQTNSERADTIISVTSTPIVYNVVFNFTVANLAYINQTPPSMGVGLTVSDYYDFFKKGNSYYQKAGFGATINGVQTPVKYDHPELYFKLPLTYGTLDSSTSTYGLSIPNYGYYGQTINRKHEADGWGTVITPMGTYNAIRVKETINTSDTIFSTSLNMGYRINMPVSYEYYWLTNGMRSYIVKAYKTGNITTMEFLFNPALTVNKNDNSSVQVYTNPASTYITVTNNNHEHTTISVFNLTGEKVFSVQYTDNVQIPVYQLPQGLYFLTLQTNTAYSVSKFIVIH